MKTLTTSSALLGMLPPPKRKTPGSGLGPGSTGSRSSLSVNKSMAKPPPPPGEADLSSIIGPSATGVADDDEEESGMMLPRGVAKGRKKEESTMDLFGLCTFAGVLLFNLLPQSQVLHCAIPILRFTTQTKDPTDSQPPHLPPHLQPSTQPPSNRPRYPQPLSRQTTFHPPLPPKTLTRAIIKPPAGHGTHTIRHTTLRSSLPLLRPCCKAKNQNWTKETDVWDITGMNTIPRVRTWLRWTFRRILPERGKSRRGRN